MTRYIFSVSNFHRISLASLRRRTKHPETSRFDTREQCGFLSAAHTSSLEWDSEGYAYQQATLNTGSRAGLAIGDALQFDRYDLDVEIEVRQVQSEQSTLLIRLHRDPSEPAGKIKLPQIGDRVGSWRWLEQDSTAQTLLDSVLKMVE